MNAEQRVRIVIGEQVIQLQMMQARIEELEAEVTRLKTAPQPGHVDEVGGPEDARAALSDEDWIARGKAYDKAQADDLPTDAEGNYIHPSDGKKAQPIFADEDVAVRKQAASLAHKPSAPGHK